MINSVLAMAIVRSVGSDQVSFEGEVVLVESSCAMLEWKVTRYRRTAIVFEDRTYFVAAAGEVPGGIHVYRLELWPEDLHDRPRVTVHYDEAYVGSRDVARRRQTRNDNASTVVNLLGPLAGFLPRRVKLRWHETYGLNPLVATRQSLSIEYLALLATGTLSMIGTITGIFGGALIWLIVSAAVLLFDLIARRHTVETNSLDQPGFYEWLWDALRVRRG